MTWQRNPLTGRWLKLFTNRWMKTCCCADPTVPVTCKDCDPPLDNVYTVTLYGFAGASDTRYAHFDGDWDIYWVSGCTWYGCFDAGYKPGTSSGPRYFSLTLTLSTIATPVSWRVQFNNTISTCEKISGGILWRRDIADLAPCSDGPPGDDYYWVNGSMMAGNADEEGVVSCSVV